MPESALGLRALTWAESTGEEGAEQRGIGVKPKGERLFLAENEGIWVRFVIFNIFYFSGFSPKNQSHNWNRISNWLCKSATFVFGLKTRGIGFVLAK